MLKAFIVKQPCTLQQEVRSHRQTLHTGLEKLQTRSDRREFENDDSISAPQRESAEDGIIPL